MGTFAACACGVCSWPGQGTRSFALDVLLGLGIGLSTEDISGPSHIYCIGLREHYYRRFKVPAMRLYASFFFYLLTVWSRVGEKKMCARGTER